MNILTLLSESVAQVQAVFRKAMGSIPVGDSIFSLFQARVK